MRRPWLLPLNPLYAAALWSKQRFASHPKHLHHPVISIGSLSAGGAGKTPVVLALADLLTREGYAIDVLTRGYGRTRTTPERVNPQGTAEAFGDEPLLLARAGLPVWVGANRYRAGTLAESAASEQIIHLPVHLLDDGFQHSQLARALDLVLLTQADANDHLLPAGNLREPLTRLRAAHAIVVREEEVPALTNTLLHHAQDTPIWQIRRTLLPLQTREKLLAFCGIARPEGFFAMLTATGANIADTISFPDHHRFLPRDFTTLITRAKCSQATGFITTEKDAMRLSDAMRTQLAVIGPVFTAPLKVAFLDEQAVLRQIIATLSQ